MRPKVTINATGPAGTSPAATPQIMSVLATITERMTARSDARSASTPPSSVEKAKTVKKAVSAVFPAASPTP